MPAEKNPLIIIAGPTGVGKSDLAVDLAIRIGGEVISADSMQVYRGMDIGTAKITPEEMRGVPHHLISRSNQMTPVGYKTTDLCKPIFRLSVLLFRDESRLTVRLL